MTLNELKVLEGAQLELWVAKALGANILTLTTGTNVAEFTREDGITWTASLHDEEFTDYWQPSRHWEEGGEIIEREKISLNYQEVAVTMNNMVSGDEAVIAPAGWTASMPAPGWVLKHPYMSWGTGSLDFTMSGPTALIAAMRCYVHSKFVPIPNAEYFAPGSGWTVPKS